MQERSISGCTQQIFRCQIQVSRYRGIIDTFHLALPWLCANVKIGAYHALQHLLQHCLGSDDSTLVMFDGYVRALVSLRGVTFSATATGKVCKYQLS